MIATQFFYTLCFIAALVGFGLVMFFFLCAGPDQKFFVKLIRVSINFITVWKLDIITEYKKEKRSMIPQNLLPQFVSDIGSQFLVNLNILSTLENRGAPTPYIHVEMLLLL